MHFFGMPYGIVLFCAYWFAQNVIELVCEQYAIWIDIILHNEVHKFI